MINERKKERLIIFFTVWFLIFCEYIFFRNVLGNDSLIGDRGDGRLTNLLAEHWWRFFQGKEKFAELLMFYPAQGVIGYTDMLLGHGLVYSLFRLFRINMYISYKFTLIFIHGIGTISMFYLLKKSMKIGFTWSLFGTIAFCFSDTFSRRIGHTQLIAVSMLPLLLIFFIGFVNNFEERRKRNIYAYLFIIWFALLTYTAWYVAFFTGMFSLVFMVVSLIKFRWAHLDVLSFIKNWLAVIRYDLIGYVIILVLVYIPFILIYVPVLQLSSGYSYSDVSMFLPEIIDLINVSESNYMMGWFIKYLKLDDRGFSGEVIEGFSCILLLFFIAMFLVQRKLRQKRNKDDNIQRKRKSLLVENIFITVILCVVMIIRLGSNGVSLWAVVYYLFPLAKSIRAVARFLFWLSFPMAVITSYCADQFFNIQSGKKFASVILIFLLFVSNINEMGVHSGWCAKEELAFLKDIPEPPQNIESFYIIDSKKTEDAAHIYQLDAFEIGTYYSIKTINGYSGQYPAGWDGIWDVCSDGYESMVFEWINKNGLTNVYAYDRAENIWISCEERKATHLDQVFWPAKNKFSISSGLEEYSQGEFAWTSQNFVTTIRNSKIKENGLVIKLTTELENYMIQNPKLDPYIKLYVDGRYIQDLSVNEGYAEYVIPMQGHIGDEYKIELKTNCYFNPKYVGINEDIRNLSIALYYIGN